MYRLPPIIPPNMVFDLPTTMYQLPVIQNSNIEHQNQQVPSTDDLNALKQLEQRQEAILNRLEKLKIDVSNLQGEAGKPTKAATGVTDVVIRASPCHPPETLPIICKKLQESFKVFTSAHIHSTLPKGIPVRFADFLPAANCPSRSKADLCVTLIWTSGKETELATSPTSSLLIKGEINLLRYFSRRFNLFNINEMSDIQFAQVDSLLESVYCETMWGSGSLVKFIASTLEPILKKSQFLAGGNKISMADVYVFSFMAKEKGGKHSQVLTEWLKRCDQAITAFKG